MLSPGEEVLHLFAGDNRVVHLINGIAAGATKRYEKHGTTQVRDLDVAFDPVLQVPDFENARVAGELRAFRTLAECRRDLAQLPERSRRALALRYGADPASREEMADALGVGVAGVKQLLRRLRIGLRECIERRMG